MIRSRSGLVAICAAVWRPTGIAPSTINRGLKELAQDSKAALRRPGGGRKSLVECDEQLTEALLALVEPSDLVANGPYLMSLPSSVLQRSPYKRSLKQLPIDLPIRPWPFVIGTLKNRTLGPVVERFIECCRHVAKSYVNPPTRAANLPKLAVS
jgi:DNA-binding transcriptional LysR family regulator